MDILDIFGHFFWTFYLNHLSPLWGYFYSVFWELSKVRRGIIICCPWVSDNMWLQLSRLVQDLLNFAVLGSLWLCGGNRWVGGVRGIWGHGGVPPHTHVHTCTRIYAHVYMYRNCKWPPTWRHPCLAWLACLTCMCVCACMHVHVCMHGTPPHTPIPTPTPIHPSATPRGGWTPRISKNLITLELIKIFQLRLKIWNLWRIPHPWMGVWFGGWVGRSVGSGQNTKNFKNVDWIKIIQFCLKIYHL